MNVFIKIMFITLHIVSAGIYLVTTLFIFAASANWVFHPTMVKVCAVNYISLQCAKWSIPSLVLGKARGVPERFIPRTNFEFFYGWLALISFIYAPWCALGSCYIPRRLVGVFITIGHLLHFIDFFKYNHDGINVKGRSDTVSPIEMWLDYATDVVVEFLRPS